MLKVAEQVREEVVEYKQKILQELIALQSSIFSSQIKQQQEQQIGKPPTANDYRVERSCTPPERKKEDGDRTSCLASCSLPHYSEAEEDEYYSSDVQVEEEEEEEKGIDPAVVFEKLTRQRFELSEKIIAFHKNKEEETSSQLKPKDGEKSEKMSRSWREELLGEMRWLATDFHQERIWKQRQSEQLVKAIVTSQEATKRRQEKRKREHAYNCANQITSFWRRMERLSATIGGGGNSSRNKTPRQMAQQTEATSHHLFDWRHTQFTLTTDKKEFSKAEMEELNEFLNKVIATYPCPSEKTGVDWMEEHRENGMLLFDEVEMGKASLVCSFLSQCEKSLEPHLIIVPRSKLHKWLFFLTKDSQVVDIFMGSQFNKKKMQRNWVHKADDNVSNNIFAVVCSTEEFTCNLSVFGAYKWGHLVLEDQAVETEELQLKLPLIFVATGRKYEKEWLQLLIVELKKERFWKALQHFRLLIQEEQNNRQQTVDMISAIDMLMSFFTYSRPRSEIESEFGAMEEHLVPVSLTDSQRRSCHDLLLRHRHDVIASWASFFSVLVHLRSICNVSDALKRQYNEQEVYTIEMLESHSSKLSALDNLLRNQLAKYQKIVVYCQMEQMLQLTELYLQHKNILCVRITGDFRCQMRGLVHFASKPLVRIALVRTNLLTSSQKSVCVFGAESVVLLDSDWTPTIEQKLRASWQQLCHLQKLVKPFCIYRIHTEQSIETALLRTGQSLAKLYLLCDISNIGSCLNSKFFEQLTPWDVITGGNTSVSSSLSDVEGTKQNDNAVLLPSPKKEEEELVPSSLVGKLSTKPNWWLSLSATPTLIPHEMQKNQWIWIYNNSSGIANNTMRSKSSIELELDTEEEILLSRTDELLPVEWYGVDLIESMSVADAETMKRDQLYLAQQAASNSSPRSLTENATKAASGVFVDQLLKNLIEDQVMSAMQYYKKIRTDHHPFFYGKKKNELLLTPNEIRNQLNNIRVTYGDEVGLYEIYLPPPYSCIVTYAEHVELIQHDLKVVPSKKRKPLRIQFRLCYQERKAIPKKKKQKLLKSEEKVRTRKEGLHQSSSNNNGLKRKLKDEVDGGGTVIGSDIASVGVNGEDENRKNKKASKKMKKDGIDKINSSKKQKKLSKKQQKAAAAAAASPTPNSVSGEGFDGEGLFDENTLRVLDSVPLDMVDSLLLNNSSKKAAKIKKNKKIKKLKAINNSNLSTGNSTSLNPANKSSYTSSPNSTSSTNQLSWSATEDRILKKLYDMYGPNWNLISCILNTYSPFPKFGHRTPTAAANSNNAIACKRRSGRQCNDRYFYRNNNPTLVKSTSSLTNNNSKKELSLNLINQRYGLICHEDEGVEGESKKSIDKKLFPALLSPLVSHWNNARTNNSSTNSTTTPCLGRVSEFDKYHNRSVLDSILQARKRKKKIPGIPVPKEDPATSGSSTSKTNNTMMMVAKKKDGNKPISDLETSCLFSEGTMSPEEVIERSKKYTGAATINAAAAQAATVINSSSTKKSAEQIVMSNRKTNSTATVHTNISKRTNSSNNQISSWGSKDLSNLQHSLSNYMPNLVGNTSLSTTGSSSNGALGGSNSNLPVTTSTLLYVIDRMPEVKTQIQNILQRTNCTEAEKVALIARLLSTTNNASSLTSTATATSMTSANSSANES